MSHDILIEPKIMTLFYLLTIVIIISSCAINSSEALKVSVSIPELVKLNDAFWLNCSHQKTNSRQQNQRTNLILDEETRPTSLAGAKQNHHQSNEEIYAIKWYKDEEEFYRYLPNAEPKVSTYETNGIQLDQSKSHEGNVFLTKADVNTEGNYRCEILSEAPIFETVRKSKHLKVYASPVRGPRIEILDSSGRVKSPKAQEISYAVGDKIELRCNSAPSKPAARLRWYLNEKELQVPINNSSGGIGNKINKNNNNNNGAQASKIHVTSSHGYDVKVTPIEYRQHYKGIFSSHSTLILILQQDDLINNKISFKCLASLRQEVPVQSKQLIILTPSQATLNANARLARARRFLSMDQEQRQLRQDSDTLVHHQAEGRQRAQNLRHGISRMPTPSSTLSSGRSNNLKLGGSTSNSEIINSLLLTEAANSNANSMPYVYEDPDSTLGPSIIDRPEMLESYLRGIGEAGGGANAASDGNDESGQKGNNNNKDDKPLDANYAIEFNKGDNIDYIQQQRDRLARQRSLPGGGSYSGGSSLKRIHATASLVKSPLYLDELDPLRPIINWPPMEAGRLMLLPPANSIVAIPTVAQLGRSNDGQAPAQIEARFVLPNRGKDLYNRNNNNEGYSTSTTDSRPFTQAMLDQLIKNLNCTCTDGIIDSKVGWLVNDLPLSTRDTTYFHTRVTQDHRPQITIGMQAAIGGMMSASPTSSSPSSLQSILAKYYKSPESSALSNSRFGNEDNNGNNANNNLHLIPNDQLRFVCQATHPLLLYSSSEIITFDFNPPPAVGDGSSIDKFNSLPSNVIQATSASQSSSATGSLNAKVSYSGSQIILSLSLALLSMVVGHQIR